MFYFGNAFLPVDLLRDICYNIKKQRREKNDER